MRTESPCQIRSATSADVPAIAAIERASFSDPWTTGAFRQMLGPFSLVGTIGGEVVGYVFARALADEGEILNLAVEQRSRTHGIGRALLKQAMDLLAEAGARTIYLEVRTSNAGGRAFYQALGFREVGRRRAYYDKPREDALVLSLEITARNASRRSG